MSSTLAAWDIYAESLEPLEHGYPLWRPEPSSEFGPVRLGDVGYVQQGRFYCLFHTMLPLHHADNKESLPEHFEPFKCEEDATPSRDIMQSVVHSQGIQQAPGSATAIIAENRYGAGY